MGKDVAGKFIALVEHVDAGGLLRPQLHDELLHHRRLLPPQGVGGVDDMEEQVGVAQLLQRGLKGLHQMVGQLADEAHGVAE